MKEIEVRFPQGEIIYEDGRRIVTSMGKRFVSTPIGRDFEIQRLTPDQMADLKLQREFKNRDKLRKRPPSSGGVRLD